MKSKKIVLVITIGIIMVFSLSFVTDNSYAYWASNLESANNVSNSTTSIGNWTQAFPWDSNYSYSIGDKVIHNGVTYQSKKNNPSKEPGVSNGWKSEWTAI